MSYQVFNSLQHPQHPDIANLIVSYRVRMRDGRVERVARDGRILDSRPMTRRERERELADISAGLRRRGLDMSYTNDTAESALYILILEKWEMDKLLALSNSVRAWGNVATPNMAFEDAVRDELIAANGKPFNLTALRIACAYECERRLAAIEESRK